ncbi:hypothetical protein ACS0TY_035921 [Phlomoides rotata]
MMNLDMNLDKRSVQIRILSRCHITISHKTNSVIANDNNTFVPSSQATTTPIPYVIEVGQTYVPQVVAHHFVPSDSRSFMVHYEKPEKFSGSNFKRWQQKMLFYLTMLHLVRFLLEDPPVVDETKLTL